MPTVPGSSLRHALSILLACSMLAGALVGIAPSARAEAVPAPFRAAILLRSLGYERGIASAEGALVLAVVAGKDAGSRADAEQMASLFAGLAERMKIGAREVSVKLVRHGKLSDTQRELAALKPAAVYFALGLEGVAAELATTADAAHWLPMCADGDRLGAGCALAARTQGDGSQIVVDLRRARAIGLSFDSRMLRLAYVID